MDASYILLIGRVFGGAPLGASHVTSNEQRRYEFGRLAEAITAALGRRQSVK